MKKIALFFLGIIFLTSCSDNDSRKSDRFIGEWSLVAVEGGITGVACIFEIGDITWMFEEADLTIKNDVLYPEQLSSSDCSINFSKKTSSYFTIENDRGLFLIVDDIEIGAIVFTTNGFWIDKNKHSDNDLADAPIWTFEKK